MPPTGPVRTSKPRRRKSTPPHGPQGLIGYQGPTPSQRRPAPKKPQGLIHVVTHTVTTQPKIRKAVRKDVRRQQRDNAVSGDRPTPRGRTHGIDATKSPEYRDALKFLVHQERKRLNLDEIGAPRRPATGAYLQHLRSLTVGPHGQYYKNGRKLGFMEAGNPLNDVLRAGQHASEKPVIAPVLKTLEQTTRPLHAVAGATDAAIRHKNILKAAGRGIANKDTTTFSDVLKHAGAPKIVRSVGGFALDVAADPTTYTTFGLSSAAKEAARSEARSAARAALRSPEASKAADEAQKAAVKRGATPAAAKAAGRRAMKVHARRAGERAGAKAAAGKATNNGLTVRVAGRSVPGVTRSTAALKRVPRAVARKTGVERTAVGRKVDAAQQSVRNASRNFASDFNPAIAPAGVNKAHYAQARMAARTARAGAQRGTFRAGQRAVAFRKAIGPKNYERVLDAIETGNVKSLPAELRRPARELQADFAKMQKAERRAGLKVTTRSNYVKHLRKQDPVRTGTPSVGSKKIKAGFQHGRTEGTIAEKNAREPGAYSTDIPELYVNRGAESSVAIAKAKLNQAMVRAGRKVERGVHLRDQLGDKESLYVIEGSDLRKVEPKSQEARDVVAGKRHGKYVILNDKLIARTRGTVGTGAERSTPGVFFDRTTGVWKLAATQVNPGYHIRNLAGEAQNAYLNENAIVLGRNAVQAARALRQMGREEDALRVLGGKAKQGKYSDFIRQAEDVGAVRAGQVGREVKQMVEGQSARRGIKAPGRLEGVGWHVTRAVNNVEDVFRLATYKGGIDRGLSPEEAMARASRNHFDYGELTPLERNVLRRALPFYTFSARNIPLQIRSLLHQPGKFAQYQKIREEFAKAFGIDLKQAQAQTDEYGQRGAPVYVKIGGKTYPISMGPSGLPLTDLNEFPVSANPSKQADEWMDRAISLLHPAVKTPVEMWANFSFFFRSPIERPEGPLAPAPSWVKHIPEKYRKELGIVPDYVNKRTGKKQWGAPAKVVYALGVLPGPVNFANRLSTPSEKQTKQQRVIGYLGVRTVPLDAVTTKINNLYDDREQVSKKAAALRQRGISAANATPEYTRLLKQERDITSQIMQLRTKRGDAIQGGRKPASSSSPVLNDPEVQKALGRARAQQQTQTGIMADPEVQAALKRLKG